MSYGLPWTETEDYLLKKHYPKPDLEIADIFKKYSRHDENVHIRTRWAIRQRRQLLKLYKLPSGFTRTLLEMRDASIQPEKKMEELIS